MDAGDVGRGHPEFGESLGAAALGVPGAERPHEERRPAERRSEDVRRDDGVVARHDDGVRAAERPHGGDRRRSGVGPVAGDRLDLPAERGAHLAERVDDLAAADDHDAGPRMHDVEHEGPTVEVDQSTGRPGVVGEGTGRGDELVVERRVARRPAPAAVRDHERARGQVRMVDDDADHDRSTCPERRPESGLDGCERFDDETGPTTAGESGTGGFGVAEQELHGGADPRPEHRTEGRGDGGVRRATQHRAGPTPVRSDDGGLVVLAGTEPADVDSPDEHGVVTSGGDGVDEFEEIAHGTTLAADGSPRSGMLARMTGRFVDKTALITGGASGIGRACALRFAEEGAAVVVADLDIERADEVAERIVAAGGRAGAVAVDVADESAVEAMVDAAVQRFGGIDLCVAAAGISHAGYVSSDDGDAREGRGRPRGVGPILDKTLEDWQRVIDVDLTGVFLTNRAVIRRMVDAGRGGAVVNIASGAAQVAIAGSVEYSVAKTGVWMLTKGFAVEVGRHGVRVNAVGPGVIETPMTAELRRSGRFVEKIERATPLRRLGQPADIAAACAFLCSDDASFVTGEIIYPDGGYLAPQRL